MRRVGLTHYKNKYPYELSGGEKQRVAIARALIKNPKIVLCDEPTGNLDKSTSKIILDLLKEVSKDYLVFMVTHDEKAAFDYAERIITLEEGLVKSEKVKRKGYKNELIIKESEILLPFYRDISIEEEELINSKLETSNLLTFDSLDNGFDELVYKDESFNEFTYKNVQFDKKAKNKLKNTYLKSGKVSSILNTIIFSLFVVLLLLIQTFLSFSSSDLILDTIKENQECALISKIEDKSLGGRGAYIPLRENDEEILFKEYEGKKYPVYNITPYTSHSDVATLFEEGIISRDEAPINNNGVYLSATNGLAIVDEDYLLSRFKNEYGELEILAGSLSNCKDGTSIIVTDYFADCIFDVRNIYENKDYNSLLGDLRGYFPNYDSYSNAINSNIGCIIKTNYREKYKKVFDTYDEIIKNKKISTSLYALQKSDEFNEYLTDISSGEISLCFSLNTNYLDDYFNNLTSARQFVRNGGVFFSKDNIFDKSDVFVETSTTIIDNSLNDYEIILSQSDYEKLIAIFKSYNIEGNEFTVFKIDGCYYDGDYSSNITLKIKKTNFNEPNFVNEKTLIELTKMQVFTYAYLLPSVTSSRKIIKKAINRDYSILDLNRNSYVLMGKTLYLFGDFFLILEIVVIFILVVYFSIFSIKSIRSKSYQIGVFKSLGMKNKDIFYIFTFKNILFALASLVLTSILCYPFFSLANSLLILSYEKLIGLKTFRIEAFYFHFDIFTYIYLGVILIFLLFTLIPLLISKRITPAKIVNNKEE